MGHTVGAAPSYLMQAVTGIVTGGAYEAPASVTTYATDGGRGRVSATFSGTVDTATEGYTVIEGAAVVSPARLLPYVGAVDIVDVFSQIRQDGLIYSVAEAATLTGYEGTLTRVTVPATVGRSGLTFDMTRVAASAFQDCGTLTALDLGKVSAVGNSAFYDCTALASLTAPDVVTIGSNGFRGCSALTAISLPNTSSLGAYSFNYCTALESVNIPAAASISGYAFRGCTAATNVTLGPLTGTVSADAFSAWTFYDSDGVTVLAKTAANLANSEFAGTYNKLVKVV
jgi:hypothetical protein